MPLKYFVGQSDAVKYFGCCHGLLFVIYCVMLIKVWGQYNWKFSKVTGAFVASLLPFGTFIMDRKLKNELMTETSLGFSNVLHTFRKYLSSPSHLLFLQVQQSNHKV